MEWSVMNVGADPGGLEAAVLEDVQEFAMHQ